MAAAPYRGGARQGCRLRREDLQEAHLDGLKCQNLVPTWQERREVSASPLIDGTRTEGGLYSRLLGWLGESYIKDTRVVNVVHCSQ